MSTPDEMMGWLPSRDGDTYNESTHRCCAVPAIETIQVRVVAQMADPPHTADRWLVTTHWQCHRREHHNGQWSFTTDDPARVESLRDKEGSDG